MVRLASWEVSVKFGRYKESSRDYIWKVGCKTSGDAPICMHCCLSAGSSHMCGQSGATDPPTLIGSSPSVSLSPLPVMSSVPWEEHQLISILSELDVEKMKAHVGRLQFVLMGSSLFLWVPVSPFPPLSIQLFFSTACPADLQQLGPHHQRQSLP